MIKNLLKKERCGEVIQVKSWNFACFLLTSFPLVCVCSTHANIFLSSSNVTLNQDINKEVKNHTETDVPILSNM